MGWQAEDLIPLFVAAIPIIAIVGGLTVGIIRSISQHRLIELAQRERIAAIERGVDFAKLPPSPPITTNGLSPEEYDRRQRMGLLIGGAVLLAAGVGLAFFLSRMNADGVWAVGAIPALIGLALLTIAGFLNPRNGRKSS